MNIDEIALEIVNICKYLRQSKLVNATHGNISAKVNNDVMLITPTGSDFFTLKKEDLVQMNIKTGQILSDGRPSKEYDLHLLAYQKRPDINAVIHAHSPNTVAISCLKDIKNLDSIVPAYTLSFAIYTKHLPMVDYFKAGSLELAQKATEKLSQGNAVVLKHHGIVVAAQNLLNALYRLEEIEENSNIALKIGLNHIALDPNAL